jgi:hypothetical protein
MHRRMLLELFAKGVALKKLRGLLPGAKHRSSGYLRNGSLDSPQGANLPVGFEQRCRLCSGRSVEF